MSLIDPKERMWASFPALRTILEKKRIPDHWYGPSSVSDNIFEITRRLLELAILIEENHAEIESRFLDDSRVQQDLHKVSQALKRMADEFRERSDRISKLMQTK